MEEAAALRAGLAGLAARHEELRVSHLSEAEHRYAFGNRRAPRYEGRAVITPRSTPVGMGNGYLGGKRQRGMTARPSCRHAGLEEVDGLKGPGPPRGV